mgnify:CR=1 FL=1
MYEPKLLDIKLSPADLSQCGTRGAVADLQLSKAIHAVTVWLESTGWIEGSDLEEIYSRAEMTDHLILAAWKAGVSPYIKTPMSEAPTPQPLPEAESVVITPTVILPVPEYVAPKEVVGVKRRVTEEMTALVERLRPTAPLRWTKEAARTWAIANEPDLRTLFAMYGGKSELAKELGIHQAYLSPVSAIVKDP